MSTKAKPVASKAGASSKPAAASASKKKTTKVVAAPTLAAARPLVAVRKLDAKDAVVEQVVLPYVFTAPIRPDIVHFVHTSMAKNKRQAYAVSAGAGHQHSAESWGTGRAVARIPRISGGGTSRAGQGAFGNMCRSGRMFAPTKIWRQWHRKINTNQKRFAVASALAASALPSIVMARGHAIEQVAEIPLVLDAGLEAKQRTKEAITILKNVGAYADVEKAKASRKVRAGKGKMRGRRHINRRGPLVVVNEDAGVSKAFRNLPGVEVANVDSLNLLQLAPGGHLGRFIIWTKAAFEKLNSNWGSYTRESSQKKGYTLPRNVMFNSDVARLINSDEVQSKVRPAIKTIVRAPLKKNPLTNLGARVKLNPYALALRRSEILGEQRRAKSRSAALEAARAGKKAELTAAQKAEKAEAKAHALSSKANEARMLGSHQLPEELAKKIAAAKPAPKAAKSAAAPKVAAKSAKK
jgi:large subunit ribosomal protein L4e